MITGISTRTFSKNVRIHILIKKKQMTYDLTTVQKQDRMTLTTLENKTTIKFLQTTVVELQNG